MTRVHAGVAINTSAAALTAINEVTTVTSMQPGLAHSTQTLQHPR